MRLVHGTVNDGDTESLIRKYLKASVMTAQGYEEKRSGAPQGESFTTVVKRHAE